MKNSNEVLHQYSLRQIEKVANRVNGNVGLFTIENEKIDGSHITINGGHLVNFGSCSYMGLETDSRLKEAAIEAVLKFGTQFSSSRAYLSVTPYAEAEELLSKIFRSQVILAPSTTLAHQACIPVIVEENDAVLLDSRAHESIQMPVQFLQSRNVTIEVVKHNDLVQLEEKIMVLKDSHRRIWFFGDGVYSTGGELAPVKELKELLDRYEQLYLYLDDAHGVSWSGTNGAGYVSTQVQSHPRLFLVASLAKGFGCTGGVIAIPNTEIRNRVRRCGSTLIFSGQLSPSVLGAIIASAKIHLSKEIYDRQRELQKKINLFTQTARLYNLPLIAENKSPINFIGVGKDSVGFNLTKRLFKLGFYANWSVFPSVPTNQSGVRILVTMHHTEDEIERLLGAVAQELPKALEDEGCTMEDLYGFFKNEFIMQASAPGSHSTYKPAQQAAR